MIISYKISRVDDRMLCEVALYGGPFGARNKTMYRRLMILLLVKNYAVTQVVPASERGLVTWLLQSYVFILIQRVLK